MSDLRQELALLRQHVAKLERRIEALESDDLDTDHDAWIERNRNAINESLAEDDAALARGEYIQGTVEELRRYFLEKTRKRIHSRRA